MREYLKKAAPRAPESDAAVRAVVAEILDAIGREGDAAVHRYSEKLGREPIFGHTRAFRA